MGMESESGGKGRTRVVLRIFARRGRSLTPVSRMEMLDDRREVLVRREETQEERVEVIG